MNKTTLLFLVILIEGYVVLACELLAIRQLIPFVGSGTEAVSIVISAVLLPLAVGYHYGGRAYRHQRGKHRLPVRKLLLKNVVSALVVLALGLSYIFMELFFGLLSVLGIHHRLLHTMLYCLLFLVAPVFLLGQTVPLVSNYFSRRRLSEVTGKMLFFSTAGSFLGSVFSTLVLMMTIGVHYTVIVTLGLLCLLILLLAWPRRFVYEKCFSLLAFVLIFALNGSGAMTELHVVSNNAYNLVSIAEDARGDRVLHINRSASAKLSQNPDDDYEYLQYLHKRFIDPIAQPGGAARDMLVIGAGGFTLGLKDRINRYTFVDIDPQLKGVIEKHFLKGSLPENKQFIAASAREFLRHEKKQYDFILIDVFTNVISVPMESVTREFLLDTKARLKNGGILVVNMIADPVFADRFSVRYDNTFASVFPAYTRQIIGDFDAWSHKTQPKNLLYIYVDRPEADDNRIYTDDKNTYSLDRN